MKKISDSMMKGKLCPLFILTVVPLYYGENNKFFPEDEALWLHPI